MRALLSVSDKAGLVDFARGLIDRGAELISTGGTARALAEAGLAVTGVSAVTGFPEMMDGRVKTLHPAVHGGILARRHRPDDLAAIDGQGITPIDLVVVNLYPFAQTAASDASVDDLIEQIDIGGPSMVRAAAKNFEDVLIVVDPGDYSRVLDLLDRTNVRKPRRRVAPRTAGGSASSWPARRSRTPPITTRRSPPRSRRSRRTARRSPDPR